MYSTKYIFVKVVAYETGATFLVCHHRPLFLLFSAFSNVNTIFTKNKMWIKISSSLRQWDSNSQSLTHESSPITY